MDSGAIGTQGLKEKDVLLSLARAIVRINQVVFENQFEVYLTRYSDTLITLEDRIQLAHRLNADVYISLHCNYASNNKARGVETYLLDGAHSFQNASFRLGERIESQAKKHLNFKSRGVKFGKYFVLTGARNKFAAVLVELGFLSNGTESAYLRSEAGLTALGVLILDSIKN